MKSMFRYVAVVLLLVGCSESSEPLEPAPPEPLPPRDNITGAYEGKLGAWDFRIRLTDDDGALSGSYAIRTSTTGEFENSGTLAGSATQRPNQALTQDVSLTLAGTLVGTFTGTATGRSRLAGTIEYQPGDGSGGLQRLEITLSRSGF
ncbi:MAG: hypothetical protein OXH46_15295 [Gemmatimonadetes bacterium]|nr:hypothetical protein [Gemmatimonadota bacterium]